MSLTNALLTALFVTHGLHVMLYAIICLSRLPRRAPKRPRKRYL